MNQLLATDRPPLRAKWFLLRYDFWLDLRNVPGRRRRALRRELRANLHDAATELGWPVALDRLGSPRALAGQAEPDDGSGPRWNVGLSLAGVAFVALFALLLVSVIGFLDGARATGGSVDGGLSLLPGVRVTTVNTPGELSVGVTGSWLLLLPVLAAFLLGSCPWRLIRRR